MYRKRMAVTIQREYPTRECTTMTDDKFRLLIEHGDIDGIRCALEAQPELANRTIRWYLNQNNESDPLTTSPIASVTDG
jgi:hypothetical protein